MIPLRPVELDWTLILFNSQTSRSPSPPKKISRPFRTKVTDRTGTINGLLYVPDLTHDDPCYDLSKSYVPTNATRQANLPPTDFTLVALAPWINAECTQAYMIAARQDPLRGFLFYLPNNGTAAPPPANSSVWDLGDDDRWKTANGYPVYAVPSNIGEEMMHQSSLYSGNMTSVPYGHEISEMPGIDPRDYVRIYAELQVSLGPQVFSLWNLMLAIIGILLLILTITSGTMHLVARSRRKSLRRRVADGEVNLEALGIKRLTVPQAQIDRLPLFTYNPDDEDDKMSPTSTRTKMNSTPTAVTFAHEEVSRGSSPTGNHFNPHETPAPLSPVSVVDESVPYPDFDLRHKYLPDSQPTCPICLDDFESGSTTIRELPCGHIYHPDCIDSFLFNNSSLCPLCKKSVLQTGYCPVRITNAMVRRERNLRQLRSRVEIDEGGDFQSDNHHGRIRHFGSSLRGAFRSTPAAAVDSQRNMVSLESRHAIMTGALPQNARISVLGNEVPETLAPGISRQDIAQQRIQELVGRSSLEGSEANEGRRPICKFIDA